MKLQNHIILLSFSFLLLVLPGCDSLYAATKFPGSQITPLPSLANDVETPTKAITPSPSIETASIIPTLGSDEAYALLHQLIAGSIDCKLPCWGGIIPGTSSNIEAETTLRPLFHPIYGGPPYTYKSHIFNGPAGGRSFYSGDIELSFVIGWDSEQDKNEVEILKLSAKALDRQNDGSLKAIYGSEPYNQLFGEYSLQKILSIYGVPSRVLTFATVYPFGNDNPYPNPEEFQLLLIYNKGIFIDYTIPLRRIGDDRGEACPFNAFFDMWLVPSGHSEFDQEMWSSWVTDSPDFSNRRTVEESTQFTMSQFYQTFKVPSKTCIDTPLTIWPQH